jgi:hypothetical protein
LGVAVLGLVGWLIFRSLHSTSVIPAEKWQVVEVPGRVKVLLPGPAQRTAQPAAGLTMIMHIVETPDHNSMYALSYSEGKLPPHRVNLPAGVLLADACDGATANLKKQGGEELSRRDIQLGSYPGKELVHRLRKGRMITRIYLAHGQLYMVMAGGVGLDADHENVKRLFDSFEIQDGGKPPAGIPGRPALPAPPTGTPGKSVNPAPPSETIQPPFAVDPKLLNSATQIYLSDMQEFDARMGPWPLGKNGLLGDPERHAIVVNGKPFAKGLGMHPDSRYPVRVRYVLGKRAARLHAAVALNDYHAPCSGFVTFEVQGDGKPLWSSKPIQVRGTVEECQVDVRGITVLELRTILHGNGWNAHAVWLDPWVRKEGVAPPAEIPPTPLAAKVELPPPPAALPLGRAPIERTTSYPLPEPVAAVRAGGGGRFLILHFPRARQLGLFDVSQAKVVRSIPVDEGILFAAGMTKLLVVVPRTKEVVRYDLLTGAREASAPAPLKVPPAAVAFGAASSGPLAISAVDYPRLGETMFFDIAAMKPLAIPFERHGFFNTSPTVSLRASANGRVFVCKDSAASTALQSGVWSKGTFHKYSGSSSRMALPSPDGQLIYAGGDLLIGELKLYPRKDSVNPNVDRLPTQEGPYFVELTYAPGPRTTLSIYRTGLDPPLLERSNIEGLERPGPGTQGGLALDERVHFIPKAGLLVVVPPARDQLRLVPVDLPAQE